MRKSYLGGISNTHKRKVLAKNDMENLLEINGEKNMLRFLKVFKNHVDQIFDMADSYLIARTAFENNLKIYKPEETSNDFE